MPSQTLPREREFLPQHRQHKQMNRTSVLSNNISGKQAPHFTATIHFQQSIPTGKNESALRGERMSANTQTAFPVRTQRDALCREIVAGRVVLR